MTDTGQDGHPRAARGRGKLNHAKTDATGYIAVIQRPRGPPARLHRSGHAVRHDASVAIVHRRTVVDDHEVDEACRGEKRLVNRDLSQAVGPSQVLHGVPRPGRSAESGFNPECQVWEIRDLSKDLIHGTGTVASQVPACKQGSLALKHLRDGKQATQATSPRR